MGGSISKDLEKMILMRVDDIQEIHSVFLTSKSLAHTVSFRKEVIALYLILKRYGSIIFIGYRHFQPERLTGLKLYDLDQFLSSKLAPDICETLLKCVEPPFSISMDIIQRMKDLKYRGLPDDTEDMKDLFFKHWRLYKYLAVEHHCTFIYKQLLNMDNKHLWKLAMILYFIDMTHEKFEELASKKPNHGLDLDAFKSEYEYRLDSDDTFRPKFLKIMSDDHFCELYSKVDDETLEGKLFTNEYINRFGW